MKKQERKPKINRLAQAIRDSGISTYKLSEMTGIHRTIISRHINGHVTNMQVDTLKKYAVALEVEPGDLID